jgi:hypothetical protein
METLSTRPERTWRSHEIRLAGAVVLAHAVITIVHGIAHARLGIELTRWGAVFVAAVVGIGPIAGFGLCWAGKRRQGGALLAATMAGALVFGLWNHFVSAGADHVAHVPAAPWRVPFQVTAGLLAATEAVGAGLGLALCAFKVD